MHRHLRGALLALGLIFHAAALAPAQTGAAPPTPTPTPAALVSPGTTAADVTAEYPLSRFMARDEPMMLRNARGEYALKVPIARRLRVTAARLHLEWTNSISLLVHRSQIRVVLNDQVLAQAPLDPRNPEGTLDVALPPELLRPGYPTLRLLVAQHYTEKCEDPAAPELWTQVNTVNSRVFLAGNLIPLQPKLSGLDVLFDARNLDPQRLHVVLPGNLDDDHLRAAALVAEGAALRLQYQPLGVSVGSAADPTVDNAFVGTADELRGVLDPTEHGRITGAYLAVRPLPGDPTRFALIVSGRDAGEVQRAALAFAYTTVALPDAPAAVIDETVVARPPPDLPRAYLQPEKAYRLADLGLRTGTVKGINTGGFRVEVNVPPDLYSHEDTELPLLLHFAHGAALRADSVFNVFLNGKFQTALPIGNGGREEVFRNYRVVIPFRGLLPGLNVVDFNPQMVPSNSDPCSVVQDENLLFTLFDDSRLIMPPVSRYVALPDLGLASRCAFPQLSRADGSELAVFVAGPDPDTVAATLTLLGKLAQRAGAPLPAAEVSLTLPRSDRHLLAVGAVDRLPAELLRAAPLDLQARQRVAHPLAAAPLPAEDYGTWRRLRARFGFGDGSPAPARQLDGAPAAVLQGTGGLGEYGLTQQFKSPFHGARVGWIVTAEGPGRLRARVGALVSPRLWDALAGDVALWTADAVAVAQAATAGGTVSPAVAVQTYRLGPTFYVGSLNPLVGMEYQFSRRPWLWLVAVLALLGAFALLTRLLLRRFKVRHHGNVKEANVNI